MNENERKEYQSVILAALLHDVGKLLHRGSEDYKGKHAEASSVFIKNFRNKLENNNLYDIELVRFLVQQHHSTQKETFKNKYLESKSEEERKRVWRLIRIVKEADGYSCAERDIKLQDKSDLDSKRVPLDSIFSNINLDPKNLRKNNVGKYHLQPFDPSAAFPEEFKDLDFDENNKLIGLFEENIPDFSKLTNFDDVLNIWLNILEKYLWAVPSDTRYEISDISLFDHLRSSAALAACMYKRHRGTIEEDKNFSWKKEFIFVGGDFSGIQNYIFDITNLGSGGASKRLRARSFFIFLFSEVVIHKILHSLDLPIVCDLFSSGGKFLLLSPNHEETTIALKKVKAEIEQEIHDTYFNQFSFLLSIMTVERYRKEFKVYSFFEIADEMFYRLEVEKNKKSQHILLDTSKNEWNVNAFKAEKRYEQYQKKGVCKICGKGPATCNEKQDKEEEGDLIECCFVCYRDKYVIGQWLPKCNFIAFGRGSVREEDMQDEKKIVIFHPRRDGYNHSEDKKICNGGYYVELLEKYENSNEYYLIYDIGENKVKKETNRLVPEKKYYANYVPCETTENIQKKVLSFEDIAEKSRWEKKDSEGNEKSYGSDLLGILKADVDNLGLVFSKGFENPKRIENDNEEIDKKTVSRYLTMSRLLELFFSGWVKDVISENNKQLLIEEFSKIEGVDKDSLKKYLKGDQIDFSKIYTVYSGGDDMVLIGPWETMIIFSIFLNMQFRRYTCKNKYITLSAGLSFVKPKHPIASAIKQADSLLEESKKRGKDRITLFGTTIEWDKLPEFIDFFLFLDEKLNDSNSNINPTFLYRLLEYHNMALRFLDYNKIEGLKYLSALSYDMGRNIVERDKVGRITKGQGEQEVLQALINKIPDKDSLIYNLKMSLFWALYRNRVAMRS